MRNELHHIMVKREHKHTNKKRTVKDPKFLIMHVKGSEIMHAVLLTIQGLNMCVQYAFTIHE